MIAANHTFIRIMQAYPTLETQLDSYSEIFELPRHLRSASSRISKMGPMAKVVKKIIN